jgi:glycine oxidase
MRVIIVGAGIAGLAIGWRLAQAGAEVELIDRGLAGCGATWAAAGMIAPGAELKDEPDDLAQFARRARTAWPDFAAELEAESGCAIGYSEPGSLIVAYDDARAQALEQHAAGLAATGTRWIEPAELRDLESLVSSEVRGALRIPDDAQVDNRLAAEALRLALIRRNVSIRENTEVRSVMIADNRVRGVIVAGDAVSSDAVIVASGAWLNGLDSAHVKLPPVTPVKGQMVAMLAPFGTLLRHLLWSEEVYLVPRPGHILVGATVEDAGFDTSVSREVCARLISAAGRIVPSIAKWELSEMWAGLRPRTPDGAPVLGASIIEGLYVAGGQFRNGILFAPAVADIMQRLVLHSQTAPDIRSFDPRRFNSA